MQAGAHAQGGSAFWEYRCLSVSGAADNLPVTYLPRSSTGRARFLQRSPALCGEYRRARESACVRHTKRSTLD